MVESKGLTLIVIVIMMLVGCSNTPPRPPVEEKILPESTPISTATPQIVTTDAKTYIEHIRVNDRSCQTPQVANLDGDMFIKMNNHYLEVTFFPDGGFGYFLDSPITISNAEHVVWEETVKFQDEDVLTPDWSIELWVAEDPSTTAGVHVRYGNSSMIPVPQWGKDVHLPPFVSDLILVFDCGQSLASPNV